MKDKLINLTYIAAVVMLLTSVCVALVAFASSGLAVPVNVNAECLPSAHAFEQADDSSGHVLVLGEQVTQPTRLTGQVREQAFARRTANAKGE